MQLRSCRTNSDIAFVLSVRNDPETRRYSRRQHELTWTDLVDAPNGGRRETVIGRLAEDIGYLHFDTLGEVCELSWAIASCFRGNGYGKKMVLAGIELVTTPILIAEIKPENLASIQIARAGCFELAEERHGMTIWRRQAFPASPPAP
jgi:RimJ/RimL family protein N-acetyltransferase